MQTIYTKVERSLEHPTTGGFSLIELLAIMLVLLLLVLALTPALTGSRPVPTGIRCMVNASRLAAAWQMYAADNSDRMVAAVHGSSAQGGGDSIYGATWASGWLDWTISTDNTNIAFLVNAKYSRLANYLKDGPEVFKCPADKYLSLAQMARGWTQRVRSYSGNIGLGTGNAEVGPWDSLYRHVKKTSDFQYPGPSETWVYVDEHPDSINDEAFFSPPPQTWVDLPATYHNGGAGFAFADGHAEIHKWTGSLRRLRGVAYTFFTPSSPRGDPDVHWVSYHTQRMNTNSY